MTIQSILSEIDAEIARLTQARKLLAAAGPAKKNAAVARIAAQPARKRKARVLSAEARKRIADAQRRRWAAQKSKKS